MSRTGRQRKQPLDEAQSATAWKKVERGASEVDALIPYVVKELSDNDHFVLKGAARSEQGGFSCGVRQEADLIHHSSIHHHFSLIIFICRPNPHRVDMGCLHFKRKEQMPTLTEAVLTLNVETRKWEG
ncbi:hypothetical protein Tco_1270592 [Tanacetum coccineum]